MLGLGIETVGYSSVRSELNAGGEAETGAHSVGAVERTIVFAGTALVAALVVAAPKANFYPSGHATAHGYSLNTERLLTRHAAGEVFAASHAVGWQEANVYAEPQEALATATLLGLPGGYYADGAASAGAVLEAAANRIRRNAGQGYVSADAVGNEHVTRNAFSSIACQAQAYAEWQLNNELFATGTALASAELSATAFIHPSLEPATGDCFATGRAHVRFVESAQALAFAEAGAVKGEHRKAAFGESYSVAQIDGIASRVTLSSGRTANAASYSAGSASRKLVPTGSAAAGAALEGSLNILSFGSGAGQVSASCEGNGVKYSCGEGGAPGMASVLVVAKVNDYYPAPSWRRLSLEARSAAITVDDAIREVVV